MQSPPPLPPTHSHLLTHLCTCHPPGYSQPGRCTLEHQADSARNMEGLVSFIMCQSWCKVDIVRGGGNIQTCTHKLKSKFLTSRDEYFHGKDDTVRCFVAGSLSFISNLHLPDVIHMMNETRPSTPFCFDLSGIHCWYLSFIARKSVCITLLLNHSKHTSCDLWPWYKQCRIHTGSPLHSSPVVVSLPDEVALLLSHMQDICSAWSVENSLLLFAGHGWHMPNVR